MEASNDFGRAGAVADLHAKRSMTPPDHPEQQEAAAGRRVEAKQSVNAAPAAPSGPESHDCDESRVRAEPPDPSLIGQIRLHYRLAKSAEQSRIAIDQRLVSFVRVYLTAWAPDATAEDREKHKKQAGRVVKALQEAAKRKEPDQPILEAVKPHKDDVELYPLAAEMVENAERSRAAFDAMARQHEKSARKRAAKLPAWERLRHIKGFSAWGLAVIVGEAGDISNYSGVRKLYKALGWAPKECYQAGETGGRMVPKAKKGRLHGIVRKPIFQAQWRGERLPTGELVTKDEQRGQPGNIPAHATGPLGEIYGATKRRHIEAGKTKGHAENLAQRTMLKALIHDVHRAWHGMPLDFAPDTTETEQP